MVLVDMLMAKVDCGEVSRREGGGREGGRQAGRGLGREERKEGGSEGGRQGGREGGRGCWPEILSPG